MEILDNRRMLLTCSTQELPTILFNIQMKTTLLDNKTPIFIPKIKTPDHGSKNSPNSPDLPDFRGLQCMQIQPSSIMVGLKNRFIQSKWTVDII